MHIGMLIQKCWIENPSLLICVKTIQNSAYGIVLDCFHTREIGLDFSSHHFWSHWITTILHKESKDHEQITNKLYITEKQVPGFWFNLFLPDKSIRLTKQWAFCIRIGVFWCTYSNDLSNLSADLNIQFYICFYHLFDKTISILSNFKNTDIH